MIVRAEIKMDGSPPPDGQSVRYFRMEYSLLTGWRVLRDTSAPWYYLKIF